MRLPTDMLIRLAHEEIEFVSERLQLLADELAKALDEGPADE